MKKIFCLLSLSAIVAMGITGCRKDVPNPAPAENPNEYVNNWIYDNMKEWYYWNDKIPANPDKTVEPEAFFKSLLNKYDAVKNPDGDRFSWIQENYADLKKILSGVVSDEIGFEYVRLNLKDSPTKQSYLLVLYPKKGSDAALKGLKRGDFITKINGQDITENNFSALTGGTGTKTLTIAKKVYNPDRRNYDLVLSPTPLTIQMQKDFAESPVYLDTILTDNHNRKVGYLVYNFFANDKDDNTYSYDKELMQKLDKISKAGVSDFILDLRYNGGGDISSAVSLTSALVKGRSTKNVCAIMEYNKNKNEQYMSSYGKDFDKLYFEDKVFDRKGNVMADVPSFNLPRVYVIVSRWTASASEMVINCLKPYMEVILIGENTVGKNMGSTTLYKENDPNNKWGMQPLILKIFNSKRESNYTAGLQPDYALSEMDEQMLFDFGDIRDIYLHTAMDLISGVNFSPTSRSTAGFTSRFTIPDNARSPHINQMYDDIHRIKR